MRAAMLLMVSACSSDARLQALESQASEDRATLGSASARITALESKVTSLGTEVDRLSKRAAAHWWCHNGFCERTEVKCQEQRDSMRAMLMKYGTDEKEAGREAGKECEPVAVAFCSRDLCFAKKEKCTKSGAGPCGEFE